MFKDTMKARQSVPDRRYGVGQGRAVVGNIMGGGDDFTVDNALPWLCDRYPAQSTL